MALGLVAWLVGSSGGTASRTAASAGSPAASRTSVSAAGSPAAGRTSASAATGQAGNSASVVSAMAPWQLPNALSRAGAAALPHGRILLMGGLLASDTSAAGIGILDTSTGKLSSVGSLASPTHDAASAVLGGRALLMGGGQSTSVATVEAVTLAAASAAAGAGASGVVVGQLPQVRSDAGAVSVSGTAYVVGGYDGSTGDTAVLSTQDGSSFSTVVTLPVDVRYAAVTAYGGKIYVFGGETAPGGTTLQYTTPSPTTSPPPGQQVAVVQVIDPATRTAKVAGYLPRGVQGAAAFVLGGQLFLAGGDSNAPGSTPSTGSTIWSFDPSTAAFRLVGHLASPVSYAAVAVEGSTAWLVGGERDGVPVATVQKVALRATS